VVIWSGGGGCPFPNVGLDADHRPVGEVAHLLSICDALCAQLALLPDKAEHNDKVRQDGDLRLSGILLIRCDGAQSQAMLLPLLRFRSWV
jgi:hypothetical protein